MSPISNATKYNQKENNPPGCKGRPKGKAKNGNEINDHYISKNVEFTPSKDDQLLDSSGIGTIISYCSVKREIGIEDISAVAVDQSHLFDPSLSFLNESTILEHQSPIDSTMKDPLGGIENCPLATSTLRKSKRLISKATKAQVQMNHKKQRKQIPKYKAVKLSSTKTNALQMTTTPQNSSVVHQRRKRKRTQPDNEDEMMSVNFTEKIRKLNDSTSDFDNNVSLQSLWDIDTDQDYFEFEFKPQIFSPEDTFDENVLPVATTGEIDHENCKTEKRQLLTEIHILRDKMQGLLERQRLIEDFIMVEFSLVFKRFSHVHGKLLELGKQRPDTNPSFSLVSGSKHLINVLKRFREINKTSTTSEETCFKDEQIAEIESEIQQKSDATIQLENSTSTDASKQHDPVDTNTVVQDVPCSREPHLTMTSLKQPKLEPNLPNKCSPKQNLEQTLSKVPNRKKKIIYRCQICKNFLGRKQGRISEHYNFHAGIVYQCGICNNIGHHAKLIKTCVKKHGIRGHSISNKITGPFLRKYTGSSKKSYTLIQITQSEADQIKTRMIQVATKKNQKIVQAFIENLDEDVSGQKATQKTSSTFSSTSKSGNASEGHSTDTNDKNEANNSVTTTDTANISINSRLISISRGETRSPPDPKNGTTDASKDLQAQSLLWKKIQHQEEQQRKAVQNTAKTSEQSEETVKQKSIPEAKTMVNDEATASKKTLGAYIPFNSATTTTCSSSTLAPSTKQSCPPIIRSQRYFPTLRDKIEHQRKNEAMQRNRNTFTGNRNFQTNNATRNPQSVNPQSINPFDVPFIRGFAPTPNNYYGGGQSFGGFQQNNMYHNQFNRPTFFQLPYRGGNPNNNFNNPIQHGNYSNLMFGAHYSQQGNNNVPRPPPPCPTRYYNSREPYRH